MIPSLNKEGRLPDGIHHCTMEELTDTFGFNSRRLTLLRHLECLIPYLQKINCPSIYVDGSFTTSKAIPNDIDLLFEDSSGTNLQFELHNAPLLFNRDYVKKKFKIDLFPAAIREEKSQKWFTEFFQSSKEGERKGILRIFL